MVQILKRPDVNVTNQKDKKAMLPKIETMNRRVVETFEMLKTIAETEVNANDRQQVSASGAKFRPTGFCVYAPPTARKRRTNDKP
ncbi:hypothetical protein Ctob_007289 [Chrysochromulina tobinii]|uniref:Uncharacterized protein n=1 Tax=Chrysochromulina tobinii TaxID=1460289 RepID=A0A0M0JUT2_9EUKA|nr:hypothetical protein Ctob_007289 [Chrysochromulina tobinii]|eukprot:KOO30295.1 hypothetical protein Ctob_007289 [Chrysochromulina sp. CCMP291]